MRLLAQVAIRLACLPAANSPYGNVLAPKQDNITTTLLKSIKNNGMHTIASDVAKKTISPTLSDVELLACTKNNAKRQKKPPNANFATSAKRRQSRLDLPEGQAALAARQAAEQAKLDAERAIQAAKDAAQTAMEHHNNDTDSDDDQGVNMNISSFEDFQNAANLKREKKRAKAKAKAAKRREKTPKMLPLCEVDDDAGYNAKKSKAASRRRYSHRRSLRRTRD